MTNTINTTAIAILLVLASLACAAQHPTGPSPPPLTLPTPTLTPRQVSQVINPYLLATHWTSAAIDAAQSDTPVLHQNLLHLPDTTCAEQATQVLTQATVSRCLSITPSTTFADWITKPTAHRTARVNLALSHLWTYLDPSAAIPPNTATAFRRLVTTDNNRSYASIASRYQQCYNPSTHTQSIVHASTPEHLAQTWLTAVDHLSTCIAAAAPTPR